MRKIIVRRTEQIPPFNEPARDLRTLNKPLWLHQRDVLAPYTTEEREAPSPDSAPVGETETLVHDDNLFFDQEYIDQFISAARQRGTAVRAAFSPANQAFMQHAWPLSRSYSRRGDLYLANLWYLPPGASDLWDAEPLVIDFHSREVGYYHVPTYMAAEQGDLVFQVPLRGLLAIDSWVHILMADVVFGLFARGARAEDRSARDAVYKLRVLWRALLEQKQVLQCSELVRVGRNCVIDPSAVILGPTTIGDNCTIGAGAVIDNCLIGSNVNISQGGHLMLSVVGDGCFLPFRASLFMTTLMENSMVAQNTCLQMCVVGRNTFIGAGNTFTDFNLVPVPIRAAVGHALREANRPVLGGCVGHNCRVGSGLVIYPARTIESDVVLVASAERRVIDRHVSYEDSDHHLLDSGHLHPRLYPREGEAVRDSW